MKSLRWPSGVGIHGQNAGGTHMPNISRNTHNIPTCTRLRVMKAPTGPNARILFIFHHILSEKKKFTIRKDARELDLIGICKTGYPGVLAVEGKKERIAGYGRIVKVWVFFFCTMNFISMADR